MQDVLGQIAQFKIVPVISLESAVDANPLADALIAGGLPIAEITFRTAAAADSIAVMTKHADILVGAGTVLNIDTVKRAIDSGAKFIVSPGFNPKVVSYCVGNKIAVIPGIATPTEIEMAIDHGIGCVKYFPAELLGGIQMLKALSAPFPMIKFMPTGGITAQNLTEYLQFEKVLACGGTWMVPKDLLAAKNFPRITELTAAACGLATTNK